MYSIEDIFSIIQSLTKSEKRYFRLHTALQKGDKNYLTLFDFLEEKKFIDDDFRNELEKLFPGNTIEPARKHLYHVVMKTLRQFDSEKNEETRLMNQLQESRILYNKGLVNLSFDQLEKVKQRALKREKFVYYILAARQELEYLVHLQFANISEYDLLEKQKKIIELLDQENQINQHAMLYEVLLLRYWKNGIMRSQKEVAALNDLLMEEYRLLNSPGEKTFEAQRLHLHFQSIYFQMTGNLEGSLTGLYDLNTLLQQNEHLWRNNAFYYFHLLSGILSDLRWMEKYDDMDFFLGRLNAIASTSNLLKLMVKYRILEHQLNRFIDQGLYLRAESLLTDRQALLRQEVLQLPFRMHAQIMFAVAKIYFGLEKYSTTLKLINNELNKPINYKNQPTQVNFLLLNLQVNALLKNYEYLSYAVRSMERKLKKERKLFGVEQLVLYLLKKYISHKPVKGLNQRLKNLINNPYERQLIKELCLDEWLKRMKIIKKEATIFDPDQNIQLQGNRSKLPN